MPPGEIRSARPHGRRSECGLLGNQEEPAGIGLHVIGRDTDQSDSVAMAQVEHRIPAVIGDAIGELACRRDPRAVDVLSYADEIAVFQVHDDIVAAAAIEQEKVIPLAARQLVVASAAGKRIRAGASEQLVVARLAEQLVGTGTAHQFIVAGARRQQIVPVAARELVVARAAIG